MEGKISYINHENHYAVVEFVDGNKKKTAKADISFDAQKKQKEKKLIPKVHQFAVGDVVDFKLSLSPRGDRMIAVNLRFRYNAALDTLINKASSNNQFKGYIKDVDGKLFVKEIDSYLFIPLIISPWQIKPAEEDFERPVIFQLENTDKKNKIFARLNSVKFIPAFYSAKRAHDKKETVEGLVTRVSPLGIYISLFDEQIRAKIPLEKKFGNTDLASSVTEGSKIKVLVTHIGDQRIIVKPVL